MADKEGLLRDMDLLYEQAKKAKEDRHALQREYEQRVYEAHMKREASQRAATEAHRQWFEERDRYSRNPYTAEAEARRVAPLEAEEKVLREASVKYAKEQEGKRRRTSSSGGRRMKYKSTRRRGKTNRRRHRKH